MIKLCDYLERHPLVGVEDKSPKRHTARRYHD